MTVKEPELKEMVRSLPPIKFKDRVGRGGIRFTLAKAFGFVPEEIVIQKVHGQNNKIVISAILTKEELKKEMAQRKKMEKIQQAINQKKK